LQEKSKEISIFRQAQHNSGPVFADFVVKKGHKRHKKNIVFHQETKKN
jgi:hypothetical protein